jgi:putative transposase
MASARPLPSEFESDIRIWHHKILDEYIVIIPEEAPVVRPDTQGPARGACVSIDPGVRTFATCYDPDGLICKWGCASLDGKPSANGTLWRMANVANSIRARMQKPNLRTNQIGRGKRHRRRRHMRKAAARIERRLKSMVDELHHKLALWLCRNYETVLLPSFNVSQMVKKKDKRGRRRKIGRKTTKQLYSLAHCRFRYYLRYLAQRYGTQVCECSEAYTTQTCGSCGHLSYVGGSDVFRCRHPSCGARFDRDENAARNIMLKFIQDQGVDVSSTSGDVLMPQS